MAASHAADRSQRSCLDGEGRRALHLAAYRFAGLPAHDRHGPVVAFHHGLRLCSHRCGLHHHAAGQRSVAAACPNVVGHSPVRMADLRPLRDLPLSARAGRFLRIQCASTACVLRRRLHHGTAFHPDRNRNVASRRQCLPLVSADLRRAPRRPVNPLFATLRIYRLHDRARRTRSLDRSAAKFQSHRSRRRQQRRV